MFYQPTCSQKNHFSFFLIQRLRIPVIAMTIVFLMAGCQKELKQVSSPDEYINKTWYNVQVPDNFFKEAPVAGVVNGKSVAYQNLNQFAANDPDNGDVPVILGDRLNNPYTVENMQAACERLYGTSEPIYANTLYVRFRPEDTDQLSALLEDNSLELQDYPMDYTLIQDGNYYQDPSMEPEQLGWLYAVVSSEYNPPTGIQFEILQELYIPLNDDLLLESMAESMAAGAIYHDAVLYDMRYIDRVDVAVPTLIVPNRLPVPCEIDPCGGSCPMPTPEMPCGGGPGDGGSGGEHRDPKIPRGVIKVQDQRTCNNAATPMQNVPLRQARVVCKRWFKVWRGYTNDAGIFISSKKFKHKVKINVKTENSHSKIVKVRGIRLWQMLFPITKQIGVFNQGAMANVDYTFTKPNPTNGSDSDLPYWVATTVHNGVIEYKEYAAADGIALPPGNIHMILSNWNLEDFRATGATPLWHKCHVLASELSTLQAFVQYFIAQPGFLAAPMGTLVSIMKNQTDIIINYLAPNGDYDCRLTSARLKETTYHELGHASRYAQAGCDYWQGYRTRVANEIAAGNPNTKPYGDGTETNAGLVAVGEMWGYNIGYIYTDRHYGDGGSPTSFIAGMQGIGYGSTGGLNCYLRAIENFDPNINSEVHRWIPEGLPYDLMDNRNDFAFGSPVLDDVNGYSIPQCFNALQSDVRTVFVFRDRLLQQNGNNQSVQVNALFNEYNY